MKNALIVSLAAVALAACGNGKVAEEPVRPVLTQVVAAGAPSARDVYSGEIRARHETELAFRVAGKLVSRAVDAGARVTRGQVLARLDPEDARLAARGAEAQLASAEGDFALAKSELERHADLLAKKFISQSAFDVRQNAFHAARARLEQARSQAALSSNQAQYTTLVADADGVVVSVSAEPGQVVTAGQPVLRLAHAGQKEVVINAPEGQLDRFKPGAVVAVSLWADRGALFAGRIREIAGGADPATRTYAVRVTILDAPPQAQLGMTANVIFPAAPDAALVLLPLSALARDGDRAAVWTVDPKTQRVSLRPVGIGQYREDGVTITSGLARGDIVVVAGVHKLRPNQVVRHVAAL
jgi:RND family efflux transporter MFP subunit